MFNETLVSIVNINRETTEHLHISSHIHLYVQNMRRTIVIGDTDNIWVHNSV